MIVQRFFQAMPSSDANRATAMSKSAKPVANSGRRCLASLAAAKHQKDAAVEADHPRVLVVQPVRVDDSLVGGEADRRAAGIARASSQGEREPEGQQPLFASAVVMTSEVHAARGVQSPS